MGKNKHIRGPRPAASSRIPAPADVPELDRNKLKAVFSFEHFDKKAECASDWGREIDGLFDSLRMASCMTWEQIRLSGGASGNRRGLGFEPCKEVVPMPSTIPQDSQQSCMRASGKARFFGTRVGTVYYVLRLDRNHTLHAV